MLAPVTELFGLMQEMPSHIFLVAIATIYLAQIIALRIWGKENLRSYSSPSC